MNGPGSDRSARWFQAIGRVEAASFIALLGIAMPLKYLANMPEPVTWVGWIHGVAFIAYGIALIAVTRTHRLSFGQFMFGGVMSLVPFGPLLLEHRWRERGVLERR